MADLLYGQVWVESAAEVGVTHGPCHINRQLACRGETQHARCEAWDTACCSGPKPGTLEARGAWRVALDAAVYQTANQAQLHALAHATQAGDSPLKSSDARGSGPLEADGWRTHPLSSASTILL